MKINDNLWYAFACPSMGYLTYLPESDTIMVDTDESLYERANTLGGLVVQPSTCDQRFSFWLGNEGDEQ